MKQFLFFIIGVLLFSTANAQLRTSAMNRMSSNPKGKQHLPALQKMDVSKITTTTEMKADIPIGKPVMTPKASQTPKKASKMEPFYKRPAGMYVSPFNASDGAGFYSIGNRVFLMMKPFADYLFEGECEGADENTTFAWDVFIRDEWHPIDYTMDVAYNSYRWIDDAPIFYAFDGDMYEEGVNYFQYQYSSYETEENVGGNVTIKATYPAWLLSSDNSETVHLMFDDESLEFMYSSKSMVPGGIHGDKYGMLDRISGADPWGDNEYGWWFGKNASHVDGMAMAFEKPQHPYLLKNVYLQAAYNDNDFVGMVVNAPIKMTCRVYRLAEIPDYQDNGCVILPAEPGELVASGEATVTPTTGEANNGLITFTLFNRDAINPTLADEYHPSIDYPILICIDGYNDEGMEDLVEFSAYCSIDNDVDEGYGELAYVKQGIFEYEYDENGDTAYDEEGFPKRYFTGEYYWSGLNNYFNGEQMKTGLSIFIGTENPFLTFNKDYYQLEDREYTFPKEGGLMQKTIWNSDSIVAITTSIDFYSTYTFNSGKWKMTHNGCESIPSWLHINLQDVGSDDYGECINAQVSADPLPEGLKFREATIRFEIPGDYIDYKFMQGDDSGFIEKGIYYTVVTDNEAIVSYKVKNFYRGDLVIPATVTHNGIEYNVVAIGESAFQQCTELSSVTIPVEITSIANNAFIGTNINSICITGEGDWNGCPLPENIKNLYIGSGVTSVPGMGVNPLTIYSYSTTPPTCDNLSFTGYNGTLHIPSSSVASYFTANYWCNFAQIIGDAVEPQEISMDSDSIDLILGEQANLEAFITPSNATPNTVSWFSSNPSIANVSNGVIRSISTGECDIYATCVGQQSICHVTVKEIEPTAIILSQDSATLIVNNQLLLTATVLPENAFYKTVTWSSSDESIATVNNGLITARKAGECDIIASCRDISAVCHVIVTNQTITITLDMEEVEILPNHIITLTPSSYPYTVQQYVVSSSDPAVAAARFINGKVQVVGIKKGTADITVSSSEPITIPATCNVTVYTESGDVNGDGFINIGDVTILIDYMLGNQIESFDSDNADVNGDSEINIGDVTTIIDMLLSLQKSLD